MIAIVITGYNAAYTLTPGAEPELRQHPLKGTLGEPTHTIDFERLTPEERNLFRAIERALDAVDFAAIGTAT